MSIHPAVRAHINGNLHIIRTCLAQIDSALVAEEEGHPSRQALADTRAQSKEAGAGAGYLDDAADKLLEKGLSQLFEDIKSAPEEVENETVFKPAD